MVLRNSLMQNIIQPTGLVNSHTLTNYQESHARMECTYDGFIRKEICGKKSTKIKDFWVRENFFSLQFYDNC